MESGEQDGGRPGRSSLPSAKAPPNGHPLIAPRPHPPSTRYQPDMFKYTTCEVSDALLKLKVRSGGFIPGESNPEILLQSQSSGPSPPAAELTPPFGPWSSLARLLQACDASPFLTSHCTGLSSL